jgi:hypothetical protein
MHCLVAKIGFLPGKQTDLIEDKDATYAVTEILIMAVSTLDGLLKIPHNVAYALLRLPKEQSCSSATTVKSETEEEWA